MTLISQTAEYALRAMVQIAVSSDDAYVRSKDLAEQTEIPPPYLSKIMRRLVAADLGDSVKGHGGGFRITKSLVKIRFLDIFEAIGFELQTNHCAFGRDRCRSKDPCLLHPLFAELNNSCYAWAARTTLQDAVNGRASMHFSVTPDPRQAAVSPTKSRS